MRKDAVLIVVYLAAFAAVTAALAAGGGLLEPDLEVRAWSEGHRPQPADTTARILNLLGQGGWLVGVCAVLAVWLGLRTRSAGWWRALQPLLYVFVAGVLTTGMLVPLKYPLTDRAAPSSPLPPERTVELFGVLPPGEYAASYPAGHVVNTVVWYGVGLLLVTALLRSYQRTGPPGPLRLVIRVAPPVIVLGTTTYLSFHWLTDGLAGLALGLLIDRLLHRLAAWWELG